MKFTIQHLKKDATKLNLAPLLQQILLDENLTFLLVFCLLPLYYERLSTCPFKDIMKDCLSVPLIDIMKDCLLVP